MGRIFLRGRRRPRFRSTDAGARRGDPRPLVLILVENLPLPGDRRVWLECTSLRDAGFRVAAITPKGAGDPGYELHRGVHLYKYRAPAATRGVLSFVWEFAYCWLATLRLVVKVVREQGRPGVLQACNPPDTFWLIALLLRPLGTRFVFDQHDLCPEVFESKYGRRGAGYRALLALERATYRCADHVVSTNESYKQVAMARGGVPESRLTVVRTGPDTSVLRRTHARPALRHGRSHLVHFHGVMGRQDGVDVVIETARLFRERGREDTFFNVLGSGDEYAALRRLVTEYGLDDMIWMPGRVSDEDLFASMSSADVGLSADPPSPLNDVSTMNKTMEYMAFGLPVLAFSLAETRVSAGMAAAYVADATPRAYADALAELLDDPERRARMGTIGVRRARERLDWRIQRPAYLSVFERLLGTSSAPSTTVGRRSPETRAPEPHLLHSRVRRRVG
jgi:glycosyltransferase involved in cell wall biosynthesis